MKVFFMLLVSCMFIVSIALAGDVQKAAVGEVKTTANDPVQVVSDNSISFNPDNSDSPGMIIGTTYYDYQTNGTTGIRIARHECGTHFVWMKGIDHWYGNRWVYYNFMDPDGQLGWSGGTPVSEIPGAGYPQMTINNEGAALIAFHNSNNLISTLAVDAACGFGLFTLHDIPDRHYGYYDFYWPYLDYDNSGNIQVTLCEQTPFYGAPQWLAHTYSTDGGSQWADLEFVDSMLTFSEIPVASSIDNKVALIYTRPIIQDNWIYLYNNDVAYIESEDGTNWNYGEVVDVTNYQYDDTVRAYTDLAACYDYNGDLHILWSALGYWAAERRATTDSCFLFHWSETTGITLVANEWTASSPGRCNLTASKMSLACDENNNLFALWTHFNNWDISRAGWSNGELYLSYSSDGGVTWLDPPMNLTNSQTPGCRAGDCESDHWSSLARFVDDWLYITYIEDKDAGAIVWGEGIETENPVRYLVVRNPIRTELDFRVVMRPCSPPVRVRHGDSFRYGGALINTTDVSQTADVWAMLNVPGMGIYGPVERFDDVLLAPNDTIIVDDLRLRVPVYAPLGTYDYTAFCGNYPNAVMDSCSFRFEVYTPVETGGDDQPVGDFILHGNYPNPFNSMTTIRFDLPATGNVRLEIYNLMGQKVATLIDGWMSAGNHSIRWDAAGFSSGIYFYKLTVGDTVITRRMTLLR
jgi:hypothetical protein